MASSFSRCYLYNTTSYYSFGVASGYGKGSVGPSTTHIYSHKYYCFFMLVILCHLVVVIIHPCVVQTKTVYLIHFLRGGTIILMFPVVVDVL